jgi:hypothetical protein
VAGAQPECPSSGQMALRLFCARARFAAIQRPLDPGSEFDRYRHALDFGLRPTLEPNGVAARCADHQSSAFAQRVDRGSTGIASGLRLRLRQAQPSLSLNGVHRMGAAAQPERGALTELSCAESPPGPDVNN